MTNDLSANFTMQTVILYTQAKYLYTKPHPLSVGVYGFQRGLEPLSCFGNHLTVTWAWGVDFMIR